MRVRKLYSFYSLTVHISLVNMSWLCMYLMGLVTEKLYLPYISLPCIYSTTTRGPSPVLENAMSFLIHIYFLLPSLVGVYTFSYMTLKAEKCFHIFSNLWQITPFAYYQNINWTGNLCESWNQPVRCQKQLHLTVLWLSFNMIMQGNRHYKAGMM